LFLFATARRILSFLLFASVYSLELSIGSFLLPNLPPTNTKLDLKHTLQQTHTLQVSFP